MNESMVTFQGWLGADVRTRQAGGVLVASFRVASTSRRLNRTTGEWHDGPTQWYTVSAWRALGEHCAASLRRGDPVVVHGRLTQSTWVTTDGVEATSLEVEASFVGHDLTRGTSAFTRSAARLPSPALPPADAAAAATVPESSRPASPESRDRVA
ncbi:MAG TPA: single-stranded DNA-binding protein [Nocardioides sp.]|nr:single-stranded DNA-binding protein [Nocardioides sp.]